MAESEQNTAPIEGSDKNVTICEEYQYLVEKAHQLFSGLRNLQEIGKKHWQPFFQRCFDVYTKLWKFQQQHRTILEDKQLFGLKRWEIGEIASKIGQLYYHYYLRTSETKYIHEAYVFYDAIRSRSYFRNIVESKRPELAIRKLRYYVRFIVVCLLLNKRNTASELVEELKSLVDQYSQSFRPSDAREWQLVLHEINSFIQADSPLSVTDVPDGTPDLSCRQKVNTHIEGMHDGQIVLEDVLIVGNQRNQVKFSELTLDMFRVMQFLEYEVEDARKNKERVNPHKYVLYCPSIQSVLLYLACATEELTGKGAMLLYYIADEAGSTEKANDESAFTLGTHGTNTGVNDGSDILRCEDISPFCRRPLVVVIDSCNSTRFSSLSTLRSFSAPLLVLLSPLVVPFGLRDHGQAGNILTLFLSSPLSGLTSVLGISKISQSTYEQCDALLVQHFGSMNGTMEEMKGEIDPIIHIFMKDFFLCSIILRFAFCCAVLRKHNTCADNAQYYPNSVPALPDSLIFHPGTVELIIELSSILGVTEDRNPFIDNKESSENIA